MPQARIFEEHSSVLPHWFAEGIGGATLIYLDAHLDLQFIDPSRIARLRQCSTPAEIAMLGSTHPLSPDRTACYGIEDFLFPAARLGLIRRVLWIAPPYVMRAGVAAALRGLAQMEGVTIEELESFHRTNGGWIEGRLFGLDLAIGELEQLSTIALTGPVVVDIDTDYFVSVPDDTVWAQPRKVIAALKEWVGAAVPVTIARSVGSGFLPLRHRFLADFLAALWEGRMEDAEHWQCVLDAEVPDKGKADLVSAWERRPDCAATCYVLALATGDAFEQARHFARAAALDASYGNDLVRRLGEFRARWKQIDLATVLGLHREVAVLEGSPEREATAWIALGLLYAAFQRLDEAVSCDSRSLGRSAGHPELALEIAKLLIARGEIDAALPLLARAAADDETRVIAWLHLAGCARAQGSLHAARGHLRAARAAAPAWPHLLDRLADVADALGDHSEARALRAEYDLLDRRVVRLLSNLS